jgi:hypothetical protein
VEEAALRAGHRAPLPEPDGRELKGGHDITANINMLSRIVAST